MKNQNKSVSEIFGKEPMNVSKPPRSFKGNYRIGLITGMLLALLLFTVMPRVLDILKINKESADIPNTSTTQSAPPPDVTDQSQIVNMVLPESVGLRVKFGNSIIKMVQNGAIDKQKFLSLYQNRQEVTEADLEILDTASDEEIIMTSKNSGLLLNLLWPLGIANKTNVLSEGPIGTQYKDQVGNFASTGGWTLGKEEGGKLFNRFPIIPLTSAQEIVVKEISENIYRPCCGNSTYFPDCNHGAAMLAFIELAVSQGIPKEEIYEKALAINSYWFPQTYTELAVYFDNEKGIPWDKVDPKTLLGVNYSSGKGYAAINRELQVKNLIPKVSTGGGGCGV